MTLTENRPISVGTRLGAMFLDHVFMTILAMIFFLPAMIPIFSDTVKVSHEQAGSNIWHGPMKYVSLFGFSLYFCKDVLNGRSIAKRILKLQIVDNDKGLAATPVQCLVRNIPLLLWPIEVIISMTNTSRRLGDRLARTKLVRYDPTFEQPRINIGKASLPVIISYGLLVLLFQMTPSTSMPKINYSETSYNPAKSKELELLISDTLGEYLIPDVLVYDTVENENLKYVSTILKLKENYISDDYNYNWLHEKTSSLLYSKLSRETFTGQVKYVYQGSGQIKVITTTIGTYIQPKNRK